MNPTKIEEQNIFKGLIKSFGELTKKRRPSRSFNKKGGRPHGDLPLCMSFSVLTDKTRALYTLNEISLTEQVQDNERSDYHKTARMVNDVLV